MSADLLAAFGAPEQAEAPASPSIEPLASFGSEQPSQSPVEGQQWILQSKPIPQPVLKKSDKPLWKQDIKGTDVLFDASDDDGDEDDFGDFEAVEENTLHTTAGKDATEATITKTASSQYVQDDHVDLLGLDDFSDMQISQPRYPVSTSSYQAGFGNDLATLGHHNPFHYESTASNELSSADFWSQTASVHDVNQTQSEQLQQIGQSGDDDWGNFEEVGTNVEDTPVSSTQNIIIPSRKARAPTLLTQQPATKAQVNDNSAADDDEDWGTFSDDIPAPTSTSTPSQPIPKSIKPPSSTSTTTPTIPANPERPTNIPPPATLLQLLPKIYHLLSQSSRQVSPSPNLASSILSIYITSARIIAGRQQRWKRDTLLSQSMRISQAGLKNTGMKLTALDRSESIKEDQEAQEVITAWQRHAAVLNSVMVKAKVQKPPMSLSVNMAVRGASGPAVLMAKECCAVCGLKRNERVNGIDVKVEDTFGEFWVEFWGHRDCCDVWYRYEGLLSRR